MKPDAQGGSVLGTSANPKNALCAPAAFRAVRGSTEKLGFLWPLWCGQTPPGAGTPGRGPRGQLCVTAGCLRRCQAVSGASALHPRHSPGGVSASLPRVPSGEAAPADHPGRHRGIAHADWPFRILGGYELDPDPSSPLVFVCGLLPAQCSVTNRCAEARVARAGVCGEQRLCPNPGQPSTVPLTLLLGRDPTSPRTQPAAPSWPGSGAVWGAGLQGTWGAARRG